MNERDESGLILDMVLVDEAELSALFFDTFFGRSIYVLVGSRDVQVKGDS